MNKLLLTTAIIVSFAAADSAQAYDKAAYVVGLGYVNAMDNEDNGTVGNIEYRSADQVFGVENLSWIAGAELDTNTSAYGYGGFLYDLALTDTISLSPSIAAGAYHQGDGKDLGGALEFRSNLELNYKLSPDSRIGLALNHKSNASLYDNNPGTETIQAVYSVSLD